MGNDDSDQASPGDLTPEQLAARIEEFRRRSPVTFRLVVVSELGVDPDTGEPVDWDARMEAFNQLDRIRDLRADIPVDRDETIERVERAESPHREDRRAGIWATGLGGRAERPRPGNRADATPAVRTEAGWEQLGNDTTAIRDFLEGRARELGHDLSELSAPFQPGRPAAGKQERFAQLARLVSEARERGATHEAIGEVLDRKRQRIAELARRGDALRAAGT